LPRLASPHNDAMDQPLPHSLAAGIREWPHALTNGAGAARFAELKAQYADHSQLSVLLADPKVERLLTGAFEGSRYLTTLASRDPDRLARVLGEAPDRRFSSATSALIAAMASAADIPTAKRLLRIYKSEIALLTALADLSGVWPVMTVTLTLSECADQAVAAAVRFLFKTAATRGQWRPLDINHPELGSGYFVLAMGKQGAFELNYSSDIDLTVFFDRDMAKSRLDSDPQTFFVRLTRDLVQLLDDRTAEGYVFRTDLRLRPDAGATQIALSTVAAHNYYENVGQNWERAAMIKARPVAGDLAAGSDFLSDLSPFIWRKYLDFAAISDIHAMKRQIDVHKDIGPISVAGQNLKLGRGGIREIEFFAQTQQLIAGGRQPDLQVRATLDALSALERRGWVKEDVRAELDHAYRFLRRLEHRVQMIADEQSHDVPAAPDALAAFARFSGYRGTRELSEALLPVLEAVERHYDGLFEQERGPSEGSGNLIFAGAKDDPKTLKELARLGYSQPAHVLAIVRGWHHGRTPVVRSPRARERLTEVQPLLIEALADTVDPDGAIASFDRFLSELPSGVQLFSLLGAQPKLIRLLADIMGSAPRLANILSRRRRLLDAVLDPQALGEGIDSAEIDALLASAFSAARANSVGEPMQDILDTARRIGSEQTFLVGIAVLTAAISAAEAGEAYATIAEKLISGLLQEVGREMEDAHGRVKGGCAGVIAMGKLGGREMTATSDVDLILVYDFAPDAGPSDGAKPLDPTHYYNRLAQRLINAISARTAEGALYDVDMRLRPSGQKGPVATRLSSFTSYQTTEAWTWEHMALTRARLIAGPPKLRSKIESLIRQVLTAPRERARLATDVVDMRRRIEVEKATADIWDLKQVRGGLVDLEFLVQYIQLAHAHAHPEILSTTTMTALQAAAAKMLIPNDDYRRLAGAGGLLHDLTQLLRLTIEGHFDPNTAPKGLKSLLCRAGGTASFGELETKLKQALADIRGIFDRIVV
jgi:[glutamine synthetase] adenylyltransferase / [glutamine synthetase]-adenylyl-L-tyrosine phosphorylase